MTNPLIRGDERPAPSALAAMRSSAGNLPGTRWAVYQNHDIGHRDLGHLQFIAVGPQNTLKEATERAPDTQACGMGWRYLHVGWVNLETGAIYAEENQTTKADR